MQHHDTARNAGPSTSIEIERGDDRDEHYTKIPNTTIRDRRLSADARGIHHWLLSHATGFKISIKSLAREFKIGRDKAYRLLHQLDDAGYTARREIRGKDGRFGYKLKVFALPKETRPTSSPSLFDSAGGKKSRRSPRQPVTENQEAAQEQTAPVTDYPRPAEPDTVITTPKKTNSEELSKREEIPVSPAAPGDAVAPYRRFTDAWMQRKLSKDPHYRWQPKDGPILAKVWEAVGRDFDFALKVLNCYFADPSDFFIGHPSSKLLSQIDRFRALAQGRTSNAKKTAAMDGRAVTAKSNSRPPSGSTLDRPFVEIAAQKHRAAEADREARAIQERGEREQLAARKSEQFEAQWRRILERAAAGIIRAPDPDAAEREAAAFNHQLVIAGVATRYLGVKLDALSSNLPAGYLRMAKRLLGLIDRPTTMALCGPRGVGKTALACGLIRAFKERDLYARYMTADDFFDGLMGASWEQRERYMQKLTRLHLLVLDEAQDRSPPPALEPKLGAIIDKRYASLRATLIISNLEPQQLEENIKDSVHRRIVEEGGYFEAEWPRIRSVDGGAI